MIKYKKLKIHFTLTLYAQFIERMHILFQPQPL